MASIARFAAMVAAGVIATLGALLPAGADDGAGVPAQKWEAWTELSGIGANHDYARRGEAALWAPITQDAGSLFFADLRGKLFADDQREGNAALGYRFMGANGWNPGFWIGFDRRQTELGTDFDQFSFGAELLSADWDLRVNGYLPLNDSELVSTAPAPTGTVVVTGGNIFLIPDADTALYELAFGGFDVEAGFRVPLERFGWNGWDGGLKDEPAPATSRHHDLRVYLGGYYFDHEDFDGEIAGARIRAEYRIENVIEAWEGSRLTFEAAYQYDDVREDQFEAGLRLRIPLGHRSPGTAYALSPQEKRMSEGIRRDTDVVSVSRTQQTGGVGAPELVEDALSGTDLNRVVYVPNGADLAAALLAAGPNTLVVANGGAVSFGGIMVFANQTLLGGGGDLQLRGRTTGALGTYTAPGVRPVIGNCCVGIYAQDNAHIAGVMVFNASSAIASWEPNSSIFVSNTVIDTAFTGLDMSQDNTTLTVRNTTIQNVFVGVFADAASPVLDMRDSIIRNAFEAGIAMLPIDGNAQITVADTVFGGVFGLAAFAFADGDTTVTGSTGNIDRMIFGVRCVRDVDATFTGSIGFSDNTAVTAPDCALLP